MLESEFFIVCLEETVRSYDRPNPPVATNFYTGTLRQRLECPDDT